MTELDGRLCAREPQQLWLFAREAHRRTCEARRPDEAPRVHAASAPAHVHAVSWLAEDMELDPVCTVEFACCSRQLHHQQRARRD